MRTVHRVIAATALGLPLLFAGSGMALAGGGGGWHHHKEECKVWQNIDQKQHQNNHIDPVSVSGNDNYVPVKPENEAGQSATNNNKCEDD
jgi:hypothetical protein